MTTAGFMKTDFKEVLFSCSTYAAKLAKARLKTALERLLMMVLDLKGNS